MTGLNESLSDIPSAYTSVFAGYMKMSQRQNTPRPLCYRQAPYFGTLLGVLPLKGVMHGKLPDQHAKLRYFKDL